MEKLLNAVTVLMGLFVLYEKFDEIRNNKQDREYAMDRLSQERQQNLSLVPTLTGLQESYGALLGQYLDLKKQLDETLDRDPDGEYAEAQITALEEFTEILKLKVNDLSQENARLLNYIGESLTSEEEVEDGTDR